MNMINSATHCFKVLVMEIAGKKIFNAARTLFKKSTLA
jgi:hypothetical protein